ncbi:MAG: DUF1501 domain-containing protein, partial [Pirellulales bacterium]
MNDKVDAMRRAPMLSPLVRRDFLTGCGLGLGSMALAALLNEDSAAADAPARVAHPLAPKPPHYAPRCKAVIQLFMVGGPSQLELFDEKPRLRQMDGQVVPPSFT